MATVAPAKPKHMYSWWWDSHISPKNSKWLQENLTDMDAKVKQMIRLIEEDADSFARRAEMYYKKRPELMKMVEEFYRAYRALAERYDHATGVLRQAHRTMSEAFPNQVPPMLGDESPGASATEGDPRTPDASLVRFPIDPDELQKDDSGMPGAVKRNGTLTEESDTASGRRGLKQVNDLFGSGGRARKGLSFQDVENQELGGKNNGNHDTRGYVESERLSKAELEISTLKNALSKLEAEKEAAHLQYQHTLEKLSSLESEVSRTKEDSMGLSEQARKAEAEAHNLKNVLAKLETEREDAMVQLQQYEDRISNLEKTISQAQKDAAELDERAGKAEADANYLKQETARLEVEKESALLQHKQLLERISEIEDKLLHAEEDARKAIERAEKAESEAENLKQTLARLTEEKEAAAVQYLQCLETIAALEHKLAVAEEEKQKLKLEIDDRVSKSKDAEERCLLLERSNQLMHSELESRSQELAAQREELTEKQQELGRLWNSLQEERIRFVEAETAFQTLQHLHSQSQDEMRSLAAEFQKRSQMLEDLEAYNQRLQNEFGQIKGENKALNEVNLSSALTIQDLQAKILQLRDTIGTLEAEIELRTDQRNALQQEIYCLKEELNELNKNHLAFTEQVESVGFSPGSFVERVKDLLNENMKLKEDCERGKGEKIALMEKLVIMDKLVEKNAFLENSLSDLNVELEVVRDRVKVLEESCQSLQDEKSSLSDENSTLVSQIHTANDYLEEVRKKNNSLENSLLDACSELEALQVRLKSLQDSCSVLESEKSNLATEKESLISELDISQKSLESLNANYKELEEKHFILEKERESLLHEVEGLKVCLGAEKQEHERLQVKFKSVDDLCLLLQSEKSALAAAKETLISKLETSEKSLESLNTCCRELQEKQFSLEKESESMLQEAEGLKACLTAEKQERATLAQVSESNLAGMAMEISMLQEKLQQKSQELYGEVEKALNVQMETFVLEESLKDFQGKSFALLLEFEKLLETSKVSKKLILELEDEKIEQQTEMRIFFERLKVLRAGLYHVLKLLDANQSIADIAAEDKALLSLVLKKLQATQGILCDLQDGNQKLVIENSLLLTLVRELQLELSNILTAKTAVDRQFSTKCEQFLLLQAAGQKLAETNEELKVKLTEKGREEAAVKGELKNLQGQLSDLQGAHLNLQDEKMKLLDEQRHLMKSLSNLRLEKHNLEEENLSVFAEIICQGMLSSLFQDFVSESSMVFKELCDDRDKLLLENDDLKEKANVMEGKVAELVKLVEKLRYELQGVEVIRADQATQIMKLSGDCDQHRQEAESAHEAIQKLEFELLRLQGESIEMKRAADVLNDELQGRVNDIDLLESEAEALFGELQISLLRAALLEGKIYDLADLCSNYEEKSHFSDMEIERLKEKVSVADADNSEMKSQIDAYASAFAFLKDSIGQLENCTASNRAASEVIGNEEKLQDSLVFDVESHEQTSDEQISKLQDGPSNLWELQTRIKAIEKAVVEKERLLMLENSSLDSKLKDAVRQIEELKSPNVSAIEPANSYSNDKEMESRWQKNAHEISEEGSEVITKDIMLDQVSESSPYLTSRRETSEDDDEMQKIWGERGKHDGGISSDVGKTQKLPGVPSQKKNTRENLSMESLGEKELSIDRLEIFKNFSGSRQDGNERKILERLDSDSEKLASLGRAVQDLKKKVVVAEKNTKGKGIEYDSVKEQLEESEQAIKRLSEMNQKLKKTIEDDSSTFDEKSALASDQAGMMKRRKISEQARRGSEKIGRLQLEVQKLQFLLAKLDDEFKSKGKAKAAEKKPRVLLRDYLYGGTGSKGRKGHLCSCLRPATKED